MVTQAIPPPSHSGNFGASSHILSEKPADLWKKWQIWEKSGGFKANLQVASLGGGPLRIFPKSADFLIILMYHRQRIYFSSTLSCNKKKEKNHQTSHFQRAPTSINQATLSACTHFNQPSNFERVRPFQSTKQLWVHAPISINQATLSVCAHFNQPSNFERARPLAHNTWPGTSIFYLPQQLMPPSSPTPRTNEPTHPSSAFEHGILWCGLTALIWPSGDITDGQKEVKITMVDTSVHEWTYRNCEEICIQKFSCFSAGRGHSVLACLLGCL